MNAVDWRVDPSADAPPSKQLVRRVLAALAAGELAPGTRLPSVRQLATLALVNHNTAARAYRDLEQLGVLRGENGLGVFATGSGPRIARELRRRSTLEAFRDAALDALRAGHTRAQLVETLPRTAPSLAKPRKPA